MRRRSVDRPVHWIWVGGQSDGRTWPRCGTMPHALGVGLVVHFVGEQREPAPFFAAFDLFLSTSREDPYPLVNLEAAAAATPIVCFDERGRCVRAGRGRLRRGRALSRRRGDGRCRRPPARRRTKNGAAPASARARRSALVTTWRWRRHSSPTSSNGAIAARPDAGAARATGASQTRGRGRCARKSAARTTTRCWRCTVWRPAMPRTAGIASRSHVVRNGRRNASSDSDAALAGKAAFKLATLDTRPDEALRWCERALALLPSHGAARELRDALTTAVLHG